MIRLNSIILFLFFFIVSTSKSIAQGEVHDILVINSYHSSFQWNQEINRGIRQSLRNSGLQYSIQTEYMDSKRIFDSIHQQKLQNLFFHKYEGIDFDIIICTDDDALNFLTGIGKDLFPDVPTVFCGINNLQVNLKKDFPRFTGVLETLHVNETVQLGINLFPDTRHIYFVGDRSTTARNLSDNFRQNLAPNYGNLQIHYVHSQKLEDLRDTLLRLPANSIVMLWPYLNRGENQLIESSLATKQITESSNSPVFGFWNFMMDNGIIGGKLLSGVPQGQLATETAIKILNGEDPANIPYQNSPEGDYIFDYVQLKKWKINLESLPENAIINNKPEGFFQRYHLMWQGFGIAMVVFTIIFLLQWYVNTSIRGVLKRELKFRNELITALPNPVLYTFDNEYAQDCNQAFEIITGISKNELNTRKISTLYPPDQIPVHQKANDQVLETQKPISFEGQLIGNNGVLYNVIFYKSALFNQRTRKYGLVESIIDITERKKAEEAIKHSEERYSLATKASRDGIWDWNPTLKKLFISQRFKEILGYQPDEYLINADNFHDGIHPDDVNIFNHQLELIEEQVKDSFSLELRIKTKSGQYIWVESNVFATYDSRQNVHRLVGSISDIEDRKQSEKSLKRWEDIFERTLMGIAIVSPDARQFNLMNSVFASLHGYEIPELIKKETLSVIKAETDAEHYSMFSLAASQGHHVSESVHVRKNGESFPVMLDITAVKDNRNEVQYFIINLQDITDRKKQEITIAQMLANEQTMNEELRSSEEELRQMLNETVKLKEKLEEGQRQFISFIDGSADFVILKDNSLRYLIVNKSFADYYNMVPQQLIGKGDDEIAPPWLAANEANIDKEVIAGNKTIIYEREVNGQFFETRKFPVIYQNQKVGIGAFIRNITRQRNIEQQVQKNEQRFKTLLENSYDMICLLDEQGTILYCTEAITKITGYLALQAQDKPMSMFLHPDDRASFEKQMEKIIGAPNEVHHLKHRIKHKIEGYKQVETIAINHKENPLINAIVFTSRDVSYEIQSRELRKNIALAQKSAEIKQQFLANMSHEIRTPMNGIVGMIEFLLKTNLDVTQQDYVETIKSSADSLLSIINDILDYSKIEAGKLSINPSPVHLKKFISESPRIFSALVKQKMLDFEIYIDESLPEYLTIDSIRLNQVISNLLSNAIKFTPSGSISLRVFPDKITSDMVILRIEVIDTGIGLSDEEQGKLFKPFSQIDSTYTRSVEGTGLGLTICQRIVELMGGEIGVISQPKKGSMFWFTIASTIPEHEKVRKFIEDTEVVPEEKLDLKILLVEDKDVNQKVIQLMLDSMGCQTDIAIHGKQAIDKLQQTHKKGENGKPLFNIILMDVQMPVMDGITATRIIRREFGSTYVIIGLSANVFASDVEGFLKSGMDDYIIKPAKTEDLYKKLLYWGKQQKHKILTDRNNQPGDVIKLISKTDLLNAENLHIIREQSKDDPMVLNELFTSFLNDAKDLIRSIIVSQQTADPALDDYLVTLRNMATSMGAQRIAEICTVMVEVSPKTDENFKNLIRYLEDSLKEFNKESRKFIGIK